MENSALRQGWDFMGEILGVKVSVDSSANDYNYETTTNNNIRNKNIRISQKNLLIDAENAHIAKINNAIDDLQKKINGHPHSTEKANVEQLKGYVAEEWHAGTFNINAIRNNSEHRAWTLQSNSEGSVDITTNFGKNYSLKYCNKVDKAENAQAALNSSHKIKYSGQERLIAKEQIEDAKYWAGKREIINKYNSNKDPVVAKNLSEAHKETAEHLTGNVSDGEGIESDDLSINESRQIAKEAKKGEFDPEKHGIKKEEQLPHELLVDEFHMNYIEQALKAGLTAASITAITQMVPELYKAIDYLIKNGEIDIKVIKDSGKRVLSATGESFLRGSIAYGLEAAIQQGVFGEAVKVVSPTAVGAMVAIVMSTIKNSLLVAAGKMMQKQMTVAFIDSVVISSGYLAAMKLGGIIAQAIAPQLPGLAYAIGSLIGCTIAVVYNIGKRKLISFCVETGFTCFGLVEQNYELPEGVLDELGIKTAPISRAQVSRSGINTPDIQQNVEHSGYETVEMTMIKRGVIGVNKIGYVI